MGALSIFISAYFALRPSIRISPIPKPGAPLITSGIYRWFRHPMYLGVLVVGAGMLINNLNWGSLTVFTALAVNMLLKANYEDGLLRSRHASAANYQNQVPGLLGRRNANN